MTERVPPTQRTDGRDAEGRACPALPGHLIAVDAGDDGGCLSGDVDEDGGGRPTIHGPVVNAREHDEARGERGAVGGRQQEGHGAYRSDTGKYTDQRADDHTDKAEKQVNRRQGDLETEVETIENVHGSPPQNPSGPTGNCRFSDFEKT